MSSSSRTMTNSDMDLYCTLVTTSGSSCGATTGDDILGSVADFVLTMRLMVGSKSSAGGFWAGGPELPCRIIDKTTQ